MGLTFDTGALIGLERRRHAMRMVLTTAVNHDVPITVPAVVIAEWWRSGVREKERALILRSVRVEPLTRCPFSPACALSLRKGQPDALRASRV